MVNAGLALQLRGERLRVQVVLLQQQCYLIGYGLALGNITCTESIVQNLYFLELIQFLLFSEIVSRMAVQDQPRDGKVF